MVANKPIKNVRNVKIDQIIVEGDSKIDVKYIAKSTLKIYDTDEQARKAEEAKTQQRLESGGNTDNFNRSKRVR